MLPAGRTNMATMRAIRIDDYGPPERLRMAEVAVPEPGPGEVRVRLSLAGVSFGDVYMRRGYYRAPHTYATVLPYIPGIDGTGRVDALGAGVTSLREGDRVAYCLGFHSYAEQAVVPAWKAVPVPDGIPDDVAVTCMVNGQTAYYLTHVLAPLERGQTCLVHAAAGSVGQLVVQLAKSRGARVLATTGTAEKAEIARRVGADVVILYRDVDFRDAVMEETGGVGVHVAYDSVGAATIKRTLKCLRRRGLCVLYGAASGPVEGDAAIAPMPDLAESGSVFLTRPNLAHYMTDEFEVRRCADALFGAYATGRIEIAIDRTFDLADARLAHERLEARSTTGKLLLRL